ALRGLDSLPGCRRARHRRRLAGGRCPRLPPTPCRAGDALGFRRCLTGQVPPSAPAAADALPGRRCPRLPPTPCRGGDAIGTADALPGRCRPRLCRRFAGLDSLPDCRRRRQPGGDTLGTADGLPHADALPGRRCPRLPPTPAGRRCPRLATASRPRFFAGLPPRAASLW
ncbi:MAG: hypothetical protein LBR05_09050, partial [Azoarcus sp.]|nr:hypothetical protein [Azoarcus sp.]